MNETTTEEKPKQRSKPLYEILPDGRWDFYIDHSTLKDFVMCQQYFDYRHLQLIKQKGGMPYVVDLGSWWSSTLEAIYLHIKDHHTITKEMALNYGADAWNKHQMDLHKDDKRYTKFGGAHGAILMIDQFYDRYLTADMGNWKIIAVESGFGLKGEVLVGENSEVVVHWVGKPDLTVLESHRLSPLDHKSVERIDPDTHAKYKPQPQIIGYAYATQFIGRSLGLDITVDRAIINVCARTEPTDKPRDGQKPRPRFVRTLVGYAPQEIEEWQRQTVAKVTRLRYSIERGEFLWNESACHNMYYRPCQFRGLCSVPPGARPDIIRGNFVKVERWIPYEPEED